MTPLQSKTPRNHSVRPPFGGRASRLVLALSIVLAVVIAPAALLPTSACAAEDSVAYVEDSSGAKAYCSDWGSAKKAAYGKGKTLVMLKDWTPGGTVYIDDSQSLTIDMNGHRISSGGSGSVIYLNEHSSLTLMSSNSSTQFSYTGFIAPDRNRVPLTLTSGGLVTGGYGMYGGGIHMEADCHLTLDSVAVAGNHNVTNEYQAGYGGAIYVKNKATIDIRNNACIRNNAAYNEGGGIYVRGDDPTTINLDSASIFENYAAQFGGGVYVHETKNVHINLKNNAAIDNNVALESGGGIYLSCTSFYIESSDNSGSVSGNQSLGDAGGNNDSMRNGGGIHACPVTYGSNKGLIKGIDIKNNYSARDGGGLELDQEQTEVVDCTITGNTAGKDGGGIYINNDNNTIENCTITGNSCDLSGKNYEGGGVFVSYTNDVKVSGLNVITGNTRGTGTGNPDDVFLSQNVGDTIRAYITGGLSKGSKVGVRTGSTGDRRIATGFNSDTTDCLFIDLDGYYVSYGTDEGGDAWQRHATKEFEAKVNGSSLGRYKYGATVTANGTSKDATKVFRRWSASESTGLYPFSGYVPDADLTNPVVSFAMPQNDADLVAEYVTRATSVTLTVDAPVPGQEFAATGSLSWEGSDGAERSVDVPVLWFEFSGGAYAPVSEAADYATEYAVMASVSQNLDADLAFALGLSGNDVTVRFTGAGAETSVNAREASVDAEGSLNLISNTVCSAGRTAQSVAGAGVTVAEGTSVDELRSLLPKTASVTTKDGKTVSLGTNIAGAQLNSVLDGDKVKMPGGGKATVYVPLVGTSSVSVPPSVALPVEVNVTSGQASEVAVPTVADDQGEGAYDRGVSVTPSCDTEGATIKYSLEHSDAGASAWTKDAENAPYSDGAAISLAAGTGGTRAYLLELWAVKGEDESAHRTLTYVIDDEQPAQTVTVTISGTDTGSSPKTVELAKCQVEKDKGVSLLAPPREGYVFEEWVVGEGDERTDTTLTLESVTEATTVTAVYTPVVSGFDVCVDVAQVDNALAKSATIKAKISGSGEYVDVTSYFAGSDGKAAITWLPPAERAAHDTCYTASLALKESGSGGVGYVLAQSPTVLINGEDVQGSAYVVKRDGKTSLCVECPNTGPAEYKSKADLADVELSFDEAVAAKGAQDAGEGLSAWGLPSTVKVAYECGESEDYDITWGGITALDESATGGQELTATGTISFADRGYVSHVGDIETVTAKVRVAAPKADPEPDPDPEPKPKPSPSPDPAPDTDTDGDADQGEGGKSGSSDKALPGTGDPSSIAAAACAATGLGALAAASRFRRRK